MALCGNNETFTEVLETLCLLLLKGVCQLVNKQNEEAGKAEAFGRADERLLEDFALYCGVSLQNFEIQQRAEQTRAKQAVTREVRNACCCVCKFRTMY